MSSTWGRPASYTASDIQTTSTLASEKLHPQRLVQPAVRRHTEPVRISNDCREHPAMSHLSRDFTPKLNGAANNVHRQLESR
jgi:hypothetical protein